MITRGSGFGTRDTGFGVRDSADFGFWVLDFGLVIPGEAFGIRILSLESRILNFESNSRSGVRDSNLES